MTHRRKWLFENLNSSSNVSKIPNPYGFVSDSSLDTSRSRTQQESQAELKMKKAWEIAQSPFSMLPLYGLLFWLIPNTPSIYTLTFAVFALMNPLRQLLTFNSAFVSLQDANNAFTLLPCKLIYLLANLLFTGLALWKISKLGLLPVTDADWLAFYGVKQPMEFVGNYN